jgi:ligand-binding sensor domain-containing protein/signal transduction histidine kinase
MKTLPVSPRILLQTAVVAILICGVAANCFSEQLPIRTYTSADGLARDQINKILQDSHGFIWFGTSEGLSRFDGYQFVNYGIKDGLPNRAVNSLLETRDGTYWIGTSEGLCYFRPGDPRPSQGGVRLTTLALDQKPTGSINAIIQDRQGVIWFGTSEGVYRVDRVAGEWRPSHVDIGLSPTGSDSRWVHALLEDRQGAFWIGAEAGLFYRTPDGRVSHYTTQHGLPGNKATSLLEDANGTVWMGGVGGLVSLKSNPDPKQPIVSRVYTRKDGLLGPLLSLARTGDGRIWGTTFTGLNSLEQLPSGEIKIRSYTRAEGLAENSVSGLLEDRDGNLWVGTESAGVMKISRDGFTSFQEIDGLSATRIVSIIENRAGELCVLGGVFDTPTKPLNVFDGNRFVSYAFGLPQGVGTTWGWYQTVFQDHLGDWWINTARGAYLFPQAASSSLPAARPKAIYSTKEGMPTDEIFRQYEDARGDVWFSTLGDNNATLARWSRADKKLHRYSPQVDGIPPAAPTAFMDDAAGNLWIGYYDGGLSRYRDGRFTFFSKQDGLPEGFIRGLYLDRKKRLWIATSRGGVARIDDSAAERPRFAVLTTADGLTSDQVTCITEDDWGRIYIGTGGGVDRLDVATGRIKHYTTADGLPDNFINVSLRDRQGTLWFGTLRGLARLVPREDASKQPPPIMINKLRAGETDHLLPELGASDIDRIELGPNQNSIQAEFVSLSFSPGEALHYQYFLEGADSSWSAPSPQRSVNFANLGSGSYRFLVRAVNADGLPSRRPATISFRVLPPIWRRTWFVVSAALVLGLLGFSFIRYRASHVAQRKRIEEALLRSREERLVELERVRKRIASDLHDDLGSSLTQISLLSEVVQQHLKQKDAAVTKPLEMIATSSRELVDSMSDIVWAINPQKDHLSDLAQRMRSHASDLLIAARIEFRFTGPAAGTDIPLGANLRREVFLIFKEGINNLVKHSDATEAQIELSLNQEELFLRVSDNGSGFDTAEENEGHGLVSMRTRSDDIGARLEVFSAAKQGTTITLRVPVPDSGSDSQSTPKTSGRLRRVTGPLRRRVLGKP